MHDFGLRRRVHRFDATPTRLVPRTTGKAKDLVDRSQGIHVIRRIVGQAMAVPPNANIDAPSPPSSNAANKTPTSSRMYISTFTSSIDLFFFGLPSFLH